MSHGPFEAPSQRTELSSLGEFGLIERLSAQVELLQASSKFGIGDDAAVIDPTGLHQVITNDMLVEGVHFDLSYMPLKHLGYKAVVVNLSDVYAMNAEPRQITVALAISSRFPVEAIDELYEGILLACSHYGVDLVGTPVGAGDTWGNETQWGVSLGNRSNLTAVGSFLIANTGAGNYASSTSWTGCVARKVRVDIGAAGASALGSAYLICLP